MKAIVDGKRYDTDKAELIETIRDDAKKDPRNKLDATYGKIVLYRTAKQNYFSVETGGILTWHDGDTFQKGEPFEAKFEPLSEKQAMKLLEEYKLYDELEKHFGDKIEDA